MDTPISWAPIEDLPADWERLRNSEIGALSQVWKEQKERLRSPESLRTFNERLVRKAAIETGIVEHLYTLDRGITLVLIERGIDAALIPHGATDKPAETVTALIQDQHDAVQGLFDFIRNTRQLSTSYIKELHAQLTRHQDTTTAMDPSGKRVEIPLRRGEWKQRPNNPLQPDGALHRYCPPEQTASEMDRLVRLHSAHHLEGVAPEVEAAWLHHRFAQIHPFQDGNGRVARCLASLVLIRAGWFPFVLERDDRNDYLEALELADQGDLQALVHQIVAAEKRAFLQAVSLVDAVKRSEKVTQAIQAVREDLQRKAEALHRSWEELKQVARKGWKLAIEKLTDTRKELLASIADLPHEVKIRVHVGKGAAESTRASWYRFQVIETAQALSYFANVGDHHAWARLQLRNDSHAEILISFHALGREYTGILAVSACFFRRDPDGDENRTISDLQPLSRDVFQLNYAEEPEVALARLDSWLDEVIAAGLDVWRRGL